MFSEISRSHGVLLFLVLFTVWLPAASSAAAAADPGATPRTGPATDVSAEAAAGAGAEHEVLKRAVGVWTATVEIPGDPGSPPHLSKGVETVTLGTGGLWTITDFTGTMEGRPFQGHGITGYDPVKRKYVAVWVDSTASSPWLSEGDYDAATRTMTMWMEGPDDEGHLTRWKLVTVSPDADTRIFTMHAPGPEGEDQVGLTITYRRRR